MAGEPIRVLFTHYGDNWFRGSEQLLMDLILHLDRTRIEPILWCNGEPIAEAARAAGIPTYRADFDYYFDYDSPRFDWGKYRALVRQGLDLVRQHNIRMIHGNSAAPSQWLVPVARIARLPLLAHLHIDYRRRGRFVCLLHQASLVIGVSRQVTADFVADGMEPGRIGVIYNGIDFSRFQAGPARDLRDEWGIESSAIVVLAVGSLIRRKGLDVLLRALPLLPGVHAVIAGDGPERPALEALTAELGLAPRVHFLGFRNDVADLYQASDILCLPSRADAFGLALAEAGYAGLPVVSTRVGGIPEVVDHGVTGLLVEPDDSAGLAAAIRQLAEDGALRQKFGAAGRERVRRLFSVEQMVAQFQDRYAQLAAIPASQLGWLGRDLSLAPYIRTVLRRR